MKRILITTIFAGVVGLLSAQAQNPTDKEEKKIVQDTAVIDNSNIPETAGSVIDDDNMMDKSDAIENKNAPEIKSDNSNQIQPADKVKMRPREK